MRCMRILSLKRGWCLDTDLCCKGSWDSHAYSNLLLDMAALNRRRACNTQGWFVFHVFFFPPFFFQAPPAHTDQGPSRHLSHISCRHFMSLVPINITAEWSSAWKSKSSIFYKQILIHYSYMNWYTLNWWEHHPNIQCPPPLTVTHGEFITDITLLVPIYLSIYLKSRDNKTKQRLRFNWV